MAVKRGPDLMADVMNAIGVLLLALFLSAFVIGVAVSLAWRIFAK